MGALHEDQYPFLITPLFVLLIMGNVSDRVGEKVKTHITWSLTFFKKSCHLAIMWKNAVKPGRPQITTWCVVIACWVPKATNTHSPYVIFSVFSIQQWLHGCTSILCYIYIVCLVCFGQNCIYRICSSK